MKNWVTCCFDNLIYPMFQPHAIQVVAVLQHLAAAACTFGGRLLPTPTLLFLLQCTSPCTRTYFVGIQPWGRTHRTGGLSAASCSGATSVLQALLAGSAVAHPFPTSHWYFYLLVGEALSFFLWVTINYLGWVNFGFSSYTLEIQPAPDFRTNKNWERSAPPLLSLIWQL